MANYEISCALSAGTSARVELPDGKVWADVKDWYVKWDTLNILFKGDTDYVEIALNSDAFEVVDWKRPTTVEVYAVNDESEVDYSKDLAET